MKKKILVINLLMFIIIVCANLSFGGFADYNDETAQKETEELLKEQQKKEEENIGKSSNNYLSSLVVEDYKLSPEFDKQTQEYNIENVTVENIKIDAVVDDERATVSGGGIVKLQDGENNIRIDVIAENESVRTYIIKVNAKKNISEEGVDEKNITDNENINTIENSNKLETANISNTSNNIIIKAIIVIFIICVIIFIVNKKKRR